MRTKLLLAATATFFALTATATATAAPQAASTERVTVIGAQAARTPMAPFLFDRMMGDYEMTDGRKLTVTGKLTGNAKTVYADLGDGPVEIVHIGKGRFVAMNKDVRFAFEGTRRHVETVRVSTVDGRRQLALAQR
ncbi:hypothetical protein [Massilia sp. H6]|uniref:hypothetical protein n=1 Tax=Massilia sp. H6 TaxID=2970464 RepID=UPI002167A7FC|nr:hypothetical protein [Massilia sp. H6]UVW29763.1 hypothetical protein NRS07_06465 [Massilia sp. H6]